MFGMTREEFAGLDEFSGQRVRLNFSDGEQTIATLSNISIDLDGSQHIVFEKVESSSRSGVYEESGLYYSPEEDLLSCSPVAD
jgi:hypothetical protein